MTYSRAVIIVAGAALSALAYQHETKTVSSMATDSDAIAYTFDRNCYVGIAGNGLEDDTIAFQRAINLASAGGCPDNTVHLEPRTYYVGPVTMTGKTPITIDGHGATLVGDPQ